MATGSEGEGRGRGRRLHSAPPSLWHLPVPPAALGHPEDVWPCPLACWTPALPPRFHPQPQADFPARPKLWLGGSGLQHSPPHMLGPSPTGSVMPTSSWRPPAPPGDPTAHRKIPKLEKGRGWLGLQPEAWAETGAGVGLGAALVSEPNPHPPFPSAAPFQVSGQATHL